MLQNSLLMTKKPFISEYIKTILPKGSVEKDATMIDLSCQTFTIPQEFSFRIIEVTEDQIARPDLISMDLYDTDMYGDLLCKINEISNPFELNEGKRLVVPEESSLSSFFTNDAYTEVTDNNSIKPVAKKKKEKRKANEAVIGDTRFKIDSQRRVVIY